MGSGLEELSKNFPVGEELAEPDAVRRELDDYLRELVNQLGYNESYIHENVAVTFDELNQENTRLDLSSPTDLRLSVGKVPHEPYIAATVMDFDAQRSRSEGERIYSKQLARSYRDISGAEKAMVLAPSDVIILDDNDPLPTLFPLDDFDPELEDLLRERAEAPPRLS
jgi:hypothetical protein